MRYSHVMQKVVTHNGKFHADDVFAIATLQLYLGKESFEVIRTRDEKEIEAADWVIDVGGVYDPNKKRFDHHQNDAPIRENGIPYAGFGLVWKHMGAEVASDAEVAKEVEKRLVLPIDAGDNGVLIYTSVHEATSPFGISDVVSSFLPLWQSSEDTDEQFFCAVDLAHKILIRVIEQARALIAMKAYVAEVYKQALDKRILVFDRLVTSSVLIEYEDVHFKVSPDDEGSAWQAVAVRKGFDTFESRTQFPEEWAGLRGEELQNTSDIATAGFCHRARFFFVAETREDAIKAARIAIEKDS